MEVYCYRVEDNQGNWYEGAVDELDVTIGPIKMAMDGKEIWFESEYYHLRDWCDENGLKCLFKTIKVDLE